MITRKEFRKYATSERGISGTAVDDIVSHMYGPEMMTRTVIEERNMPFREVDVFSRLMADRIIFLGTEIDDYIAKRKETVKGYAVNTEIFKKCTESASIKTCNSLEWWREKFGIRCDQNLVCTRAILET